MTTVKGLCAAAVALGCMLAPGLARAQTPAASQDYRVTTQQGIRRITLNTVVTNAPYSADVMSTVTQVLADGTRIEQRVTGKIARDTAGRMRREQQVIGLGPLAPGTDPVTVVTITDPTTRSTYTINDQARTAAKAPYAQVLQWNTPTQWITPVGRGYVNWIDDPASAPGLAAIRLRSGDALSDSLAALAIAPGQLRLNGEPVPALAPGAGQGARQGGGRGARSGGASAALTGDTYEALGSRQMEGVVADGTRVSATIPTGQIGNDRPIVLSDEVWESSELRLIVYSKHHDPRTGDVEYRLRNISRNEPPAQLFQVPAGYTVVEPLPLPAPVAPGSRSGGGRGGALAVPAPPGTRAPGQ